MTNVRETFATLFENNHSHHQKLLDFQKNLLDTIKRINQEVSQNLINMGYDLSYIMDGPVSKFDQYSPIDLESYVIVEARTRRLPFKYTLNSNIEELIKNITQDFVTEIQSLLATSKFCPYQLVVSTGVVIDPNNRLPSISFMTRYGLLENIYQPGPIGDPGQRLLSNYEAAISRTGPPQIYGSDFLSITDTQSTVDKIIEKFLLSYADELKLTPDNIAVSNTVPTQYTTNVASWSFEAIQDSSARSIAAVDEALTTLALDLKTSMKSIIDSKAPEQIFKLVNIVSSGPMIDPNTFEPIMKFGFEYALV